RDVRFEGAALDGLKLLITPVMPYVSPEFLAKVEKFVRAGGVWICAPTTGTRGVEHTVPTDAGLGAVDAFAGIETVFSFPITGTGSTGKAFGLTAPVAGWCSALKPAARDTKVVGTLKSEQAPGLAFLTERKLGRGAVVVLGALPDGQAGAKLLAKLVVHYAAQAGVTLRFNATPGTLVCPRVASDGKKLWVVVNLDGKGGKVRLPAGATDALTGKKLPAGPLKLARYAWRAVRV
ncbi:MAG: beta-galactosidase trimerization domain-containing protein, partial [Oleiharenicola lentus]